MWTPTALTSNSRRLAGNIWRVVEHQSQSATWDLVDTHAEHEALELLLEDNKPPYPPGCERLHYLLKTPFRYAAPYPHGSRFRRAGKAPGVFYASETLRTGFAETAYHRLRFLAASPATPTPQHEQQLTVFSCDFATSGGLDLTADPLSRDRAQWIHPTDYTATQALADTARSANIEAIRYESARDPDHGCNIALLTPKSFASDKPTAQQSWSFILKKDEAIFSPATGDWPSIWFSRADLTF